MKTLIKEIKSDWKKTRVLIAILIGIGFFFSAWFPEKFWITNNIEEYIVWWIKMLYIIFITELVFKK